MPRYYFNLRDGRDSLDEEGSELADIHAARKKAVTLSGEVLRDGAGDSLWDGATWKLWVTDAPAGKGKTFFTLSFSAVEGS
jgi:ATP/maltotriose-dependent transcriptional regulator MalT